MTPSFSKWYRLHLAQLQSHPQWEGMSEGERLEEIAYQCYLLNELTTDDAALAKFNAECKNDQAYIDGYKEGWGDSTNGNDNQYP